MRQPSSHQRHASRRVGIVLGLAVLVFVAGLLQAGVLKDLFRDKLELRVEMPESGLNGLSVGASVEVLGTQAGEVTDIVLQPDAPFYVDVALDPAMRPFVRRDSTAVMRKQFGIAGTTYLEIERGTGPALDWDFAVIQARTGPALTESVSDLIADVRDKVFPVIEDSQRTLSALAELSEALAARDGDLRGALADLRAVTDDVAAGQGSLGRLLRDERAAKGLERGIAALNRNLDRLSGVIDNLETGSADLAVAAETLRSEERGLPTALDRANQSLKALRDLLDRASESAPALRKTAENAASASETLPSLLVRTEATLSELSSVLRQLRRSWLLGGGDDGDEGEPGTLSPLREPPQ